MQRYIQTAYWWLLDPKTWKFIEWGRQITPCRVDTPFYLWNHGSAKGSRVSDGKREWYRIKTIQLNGFKVKMESSYKRGEIMLGNGMQFIVGCYPKRRHNYNGSVTVIGCDFSVSFDKEPIVFTSMYDAEYSFVHVTELGQVAEDGRIRDSFSYGLLPSRYVICYRGRQMRLERYVLVCGSWAVLLTDDMQFETLCALGGMTNSVLNINRVIYTLNPYIVKAMTLG